MSIVSNVEENVLSPFVFDSKENQSEYSNEGVEIEFEYLCKFSCEEIAKSNLTKNIANLPINIKKNKYQWIVPFDQMRIKLSKTDLDSDYINASFIPSINDPNSTEFIVAQDPIDETINEFWLMIWEQNVSLILNLSNRDFKQYWLNGMNNNDGIYASSEFSIEIVNKEEHNLFIERNFLLENMITKEKRNIIHFHMNVWNATNSPDFEGFERLLGLIQNLLCDPPYLIHSSAGIGRCGTFIAIYRLMKKISNGQQCINIADEIVELRKYRDFMVQSKDQYIFIHTFIHEVIRRRRNSSFKWDSYKNRYEYHI